MYIFYQPNKNELQQINNRDFIKLGWETNENRNLRGEFQLETEEDLCSFAKQLSLSYYQFQLLL